MPQTLPSVTVGDVLDNARTSTAALEIAVDALAIIALRHDTLEGQRAIEALRRIRAVMVDGE